MCATLLLLLSVSAVHLAGEKLPKGHVRCPNCAAMLPAAFINSHLDSCLTGDGSAGGNRANGARRSGGSAAAKPGSGGGAKFGSGGSAKPGSGGGSKPGVGGGGGGREALKVPPKLCVALMTDKAMRDTCRKFGLPSVGKKDVSAFATSLLP